MSNDNLELVEATLTRAAELLGDITPRTIEELYRRFPEMEASFEHHGLGKKTQLEADMVKNSLYCLMDWNADPSGVEVVLANSVPHHHYTLNVPPAWYAGLLQVTADVIGDPIPDEASEERRAWETLTEQLRNVLKESSEATDAPLA